MRNGQSARKRHASSISQQSYFMARSAYALGFFVCTMAFHDVPRTARERCARGRARAFSHYFDRHSRARCRFFHKMGAPLAS